MPDQTFKQWTIQVCPDCNGLASGAAVVAHSGGCPSYYKTAVPLKLVVVAPVHQGDLVMPKIDSRVLVGDDIMECDCQEVPCKHTPSHARPSLRKLYPPYKATYDLRLDEQHIAALDRLLTWVHARSSRRHDQEFYETLAEIGAALTQVALDVAERLLDADADGEVCKSCGETQTGDEIVADLKREAEANQYGVDPDGEVCKSCGHLVAVTCPSWWRAPDDLWNEVEGGPGGIRCIPCFTRDCDAAGVPIHWEAVRGV